VRDVSRGGIHLVAERRFEPGELLSVDLPAPEGQACAVVLAYVVRVAPQHGGNWSVGCIFAIELGDEDLRLFGAEREKSPQADPRTWVRFPSDARATFQQVRDPDAPPRAAAVLNICPGGVGLLSDRALDLGALLRVELRGTSGPAALTMTASVVRVSPRPEGDWALGCNFLRELTHKEIQALL
jgi:hypothetical protein